jgi:Nop14-like family
MRQAPSRAAGPADARGAADIDLWNGRVERPFCCLCRRERAATKRLKRQVQKERRGAMQELRKDATFLDAERKKVGFY